MKWRGTAHPFLPAAIIAIALSHPIYQASNQKTLPRFSFGPLVKGELRVPVPQQPHLDQSAVARFEQGVPRVLGDDDLFSVAGNV